MDIHACYALAATKTFTIKAKQGLQCHHKPGQFQAPAEPMLIPLAVGLLGPDGGSEGQSGGAPRT